MNPRADPAAEEFRMSTEEAEVLERSMSQKEEHEPEPGEQG